MYVNVLAGVLGILLLQHLPELPTRGEGHALAAVACVAAALALALRRRVPLAARAAVIALSLLAGFGWAAMRAEYRLAEHLPSWAEGQDLLVTGVIATLVERRERSLGFEFDVEQAGLPIPSRLRLAWYEDSRRDAVPLPALAPGQRWRLPLRLKRPHASLNPHAADYEGRLLEEGIRANGYVRDGAERLAGSGGGWRVAVEALRARLRERFEAALAGQPWAGLLIAITLGDQQAMPREQWSLFQRTGLVHAAVVSGMHVTMMAALGGVLAAALWRRSRAALYLPARKFGILAGLGCACAYGLIAGLGIPIQRSLLMLSTVAVCLLANRLVSPTRMLVLALLAVLALDPWAVLVPGFWLSFVAVGILLFLTLGSRHQEPWYLAALKIQLAINLAMIPVLLIFFQQFSLVAPAANLLAVPLLSFVVLPLCLLFVLLPWPPLLEFAHMLTAALMLPVEWLGSSTLAVWQQAAAPAGLLLVAALGCIWALLPRGTPGRLGGVLGLLPLLIWQPPRPAPGEFELVVLDVGQGLAVHVRTAQHDLLFDTGPAWPGGDSGERVVLPYLRAAGARRLDAMVVSHADSDHAGGAGSLLVALPVERRFTHAGADTSRFSSGSGWVDCSPAMAWEWDQVSFRFLSPPAGFMRLSPKDGNNRSCLLRIESAGGRALLAADIELVAERGLLAAGASDLAAEVVLAPHHGSRSSSSPEFVAATAARAVIYSVGHRSQFGHPHPEVWARWAAAGARGYRTDSQGALRVRFTAAGVAIDSERELRPRYWHGR